MKDITKNVSAVADQPHTVIHGAGTPLLSPLTALHLHKSHGEIDQEIIGS